MVWNLLNKLDPIFSWLFLYVMIALIWIGAEYMFEGAVHSSHVDSVVNGILATYALRDWYRNNK